ncbi:MAG: dephospho-CoA kinase [Alphaproteobacteria bacterium]|nr:MAG: dephospho-CoA kinase [Alphaproteobacteria bacterium]
MKVLGLTGSIGMGKSVTAGMFRRLGVPVFDADAVVHRLLGAKGAAYDAVARAFAGVAGAAGIDRAALGARVFGDAVAMARLEGILHPLVAQARRHWLQRQRRRRCRLVVLDIPLLYETGGAVLCDAVVVVSAPALVQRQRVLARPGMDAQKFVAILARQMPDAAKRRRAHWIVPTGLGRRFALDRVKRIKQAFMVGSGTDGHA